MASSTTVITAPAVEPVLAADVKTFLHITSTDDALIDELIAATRIEIEAAVKRSLINTTWELRLDAFPDGGVIELPRPPLQSVTSVKYYDTEGVLTTLATTEYSVDAPAGPFAVPGRVLLGYAKSWPATRGIPNAVTVRFVAGYGATAATVPGGLRTAIKLLAGDLYSNPGLDVVTRRVGPTEVSYRSSPEAWSPTLRRIIAPYTAYAPATFGAAG